MTSGKECPDESRGQGVFTTRRTRAEKPGPKLRRSTDGSAGSAGRQIWGASELMFCDLKVDWNSSSNQEFTTGISHLIKSAKICPQLPLHSAVMHRALCVLFYSGFGSSANAEVALCSVMLLRCRDVFWALVGPQALRCFPRQCFLGFQMVPGASPVESCYWHRLPWQQCKERRSQGCHFFCQVYRFEWFHGSIMKHSWFEDVLSFFFRFHLTTMQYVLHCSWLFLIMTTLSHNFSPFLSEWWFGTFFRFFMTFQILGISSPQLTNSIIFSEGRVNHQPDYYFPSLTIYIYIYL